MGKTSLSREHKDRVELAYQEEPYLDAKAKEKKAAELNIPLVGFKSHWYELSSVKKNKGNALTKAIRTKKDEISRMEGGPGEEAKALFLAELDNGTFAARVSGVGPLGGVPTAAATPVAPAVPVVTRPRGPFPPNPNTVTRKKQRMRESMAATAESWGDIQFTSDMFSGGQNLFKVTKAER